MDEKIESINETYDKIKIDKLDVEKIKKEFSLHRQLSEPLLKYIDESIVKIIEYSNNEDSNQIEMLFQCISGIKNHLIATADQYKRNLLIVDSINNVSLIQDKKIEEFINSLEAKERFKNKIEGKIEEGEDPRKRKVGEVPIPEREIRLSEDKNGE
ncbi:hypothetical protein CL622_01585 [archaeon]|nr:hypothetical protein [archaeon]